MLWEFRTWRGERGLVDLAQIEELIAPRTSPFLVATAAVAVENTHNRGGGLVQPLGELQELWDWSRGAGVAVHLDGARIWNASVASGVDLATYGRLADTASVCFSKGRMRPWTRPICNPCSCCCSSRAVFSAA